MRPFKTLLKARTLILASTLSLSIASGSITLNLAAQPSLTPQQEHLFAIALEAWAISTATTIEVIREGFGEE